MDMDDLRIGDISAELAVALLSWKQKNFKKGFKAKALYVPASALKVYRWTRTAKSAETS